MSLLQIKQFYFLDEDPSDSESVIVPQETDCFSLALALLMAQEMISYDCYAENTTIYENWGFLLRRLESGETSIDYHSSGMDFYHRIEVKVLS